MSPINGEVRQLQPKPPDLRIRAGLPCGIRFATSARKVNLFSEVRRADYACFYLALGAYWVFLLIAVLTRVGKGASPQLTLNRLHLRCSGVYFVAAGVYLGIRASAFRISGLADFVVGALLYFGIQYAILLPFFALSQASVSTAILSIIHASGGRATAQQCDAAYAGGQGFAYIKRSRMSRLQEILGWVRLQDGKYRLTPRGAAAAGLTKLILRIWCLRQIGRRP